MGFFSGIGKVGGVVFNIRYKEWLDLHGLGIITSYFIRNLKNLFPGKGLERRETFEQALQRLQLTPEELRIQSQRFSFLAFFFLGMSLLIFCYFLWMLLSGSLMSAGMTFSLMIYSLSVAFRYHFWNFQIHRQKLGCTLGEWLSGFSAKRTNP
jgi:intracellular multiplication protein IcmV